MNASALTEVEVGPRAANENLVFAAGFWVRADNVEQDLVVEKGKVTAYRTKLKLSFKYEGGG